MRPLRFYSLLIETYLDARYNNLGDEGQVLQDAAEGREGFMLIEQVRAMIPFKKGGENAQACTALWNSVIQS